MARQPMFDDGPADAPPAATGAKGGYLVLARKYRPQRFDDLIGQSHVIRTLKNAIEQNRVHHAYLFTGSRGLGKTSTARILARALNCERGPTPEPCGECAVCRQIGGGGGAESWVLTEIDGASNNSVDDVRELRSTIGQKTGARFRVIVIDEVHMLSTAAFNALLKTLEEPPPHVKFVFATTEIQKVPETIISRCQRLDFRRIGASDIAGALQAIAARESINADDEALKLIARIAEGGMRDSLSKLDQAIAFCGTTITAADIERIFGILSRRNLLELVESFASRHHAAALGVAARVHDEGLDVAQVLRDLVDLFRDIAVIGTCGADTPLVDAMADDRERMRELATRLGSDTMLMAVEIVSEGMRRVRTSGFPRISLEVTFIKLCELSDLVALPQLVEALSGKSLGSAPVPAARPAAPAAAARPATPTPAAPAAAATPAAEAGDGTKRRFGAVADQLGEKPSAGQKKNAPAAVEAAVAAPATATATTLVEPPAPAPASRGTERLLAPPDDDESGDDYDSDEDDRRAGDASPRRTADTEVIVSSPAESGGAVGNRPPGARAPGSPQSQPPRQSAAASRETESLPPRSRGKRVGTDLLQRMDDRQTRPTGNGAGPGAAAQLREQESVRKLVEAFEGEIIRVDVDDGSHLA